MPYPETHWANLLKKAAIHAGSCRGLAFLRSRISARARRSSVLVNGIANLGAVCMATSKTKTPHLAGLGSRPGRKVGILHGPILRGRGRAGMAFIGFTG